MEANIWNITRYLTQAYRTELPNQAKIRPQSYLHMGLIKLNVKHACKLHEVSIDADTNGLHLKQELERLTSVPVARQKVMVKGRQLQDSAILSSVPLKDGQALFMLGSVPKNEALAASASNTNEGSGDAQMGMAEEVSEEEGDEILQPVGLVNLGNTCYANATLEALRTVPELNDLLKNYKGDDSLVRSWGKLVPEFGQMAPYNADAAIPAAFMQELRQRLPQFAEMGEEGFPKQQDAEEFWTQLLFELSKVDDPAASAVASSFDGRFEITTERGSGTEQTEESFAKLMCHITIRTNFLKDGLKSSLVDEIEAEEGADATRITKKISKLPKYLTIQFVRFYWRRDTQKNSKILRKVTFPLNLDLGDLCTEELQSSMAPAREAYRELETAIEESRRAARRAKFQRLDAVPADPAEAAADPTEAAKLKAAADAEQQEEKREKKKLISLREKFQKLTSARLDADGTCSPHGLYELEAIVTHQGMSADSGHYQCFTRNRSKPNSWWRFNDDRVSEVGDERIAQLAGGGASDSALILLYKSSES